MKKKLYYIFDKIEKNNYCVVLYYINMTLYDYKL